MALGKTQIKIGGEIVARRVAPFAVDEAVGGRQELERIDAEILEVRPADRERRHPREVAGRGAPLYERKNVAERSPTDADGALRLGPAPPGRELVDDKPVIGGKTVEGDIVVPVRFLSAGVAWDELAIAPLDHGGRAAIVVGERRRQHRAQPPFHRRGGRIRAQNACRRRRLRVGVRHLEPIVVDVIVHESAGRGSHFP
jgi:hypothetical protein